MNEIYEQIIELFDSNQPSVMITILDKSGSAPREEGTKMLVKKDFSIVGTIGGGILEAVSIKLSSKVFENKEYIIEDFSLTNNDAKSVGMVCGGKVKVLLEYIDPDDYQMVNAYKKMNECSQKQVDFVLITRLKENNGYLSGRDKWICTETGFFGVEDEEVLDIAKSVREDFHQLKIHIKNEKERVLIEPHFNYESVCIVGAGHVAQKIAELTTNLGFYTIVLDDREEFANRERFQKVDEVKVIESFHKLSEYVTITANSYIIIVTRGHSNDKEVLAQMLKTDAKYIGMIGSRSKRDITYKILKEEGFTSEDLSRVFCPIGVNIYAQTPEEIAISIAAEVIKVRRGPKDEE
ncbi:MAG: molybdenum dehydrogenase [Firmicutes bacterium HGW-Firmicutes-7]|nr:MAG: molybdenum dehydrogenase [Firmicutes bacterium HGW-Firmicutes-7]